MATKQFVVNPLAVDSMLEWLESEAQLAAGNEGVLFDLPLGELRVKYSPPKDPRKVKDEARQFLYVWEYRTPARIAHDREFGYIPDDKLGWDGVSRADAGRLLAMDRPLELAAFEAERDAEASAIFARIARNADARID